MLMILTACLSQPEPVVVTQTEYQKQNIPIQARPPLVDFPPMEWMIITEDNLDEKVNELKSKSKNTPVENRTLQGQITKTFVKGKIAFERD